MAAGAYSSCSDGNEVQYVVKMPPRDLSGGAARSRVGRTGSNEEMHLVAASTLVAFLLVIRVASSFRVV